MAQQQFDRVADMLQLDESVREYLRWPQKEFHFRIPVRMDDGSVRLFHGLRVQHNNARVLTKAACASTIRNVDASRAGHWMTWSARLPIYPWAGQRRRGSRPGGAFQRGERAPRARLGAADA
jgi:glutamate dehydrogenase (NAD(P)+)